MGKLKPGQIIPFDGPEQRRTIEAELAAKQAEGKPAIHMAPTSAILALCKQLEYGATKHGKDDWRKGLPWLERWDSAMRHLLAWREGEDIDPDSGEYQRPHLHAVICQIAMLIEYAETHLELDNRSGT